MDICSAARWRSSSSPGSAGEIRRLLAGHHARLHHLDRAATFSRRFRLEKLGLDYGSVKFPIMAMGNMSYSNSPTTPNIRYRWDL